jgi:anti-sigma regulatory factor (Ser/Thr protein kinase)
MRELALHILDLVQNSLEAGASSVLLEIVEDHTADTLTICVKDNGRGMDEVTSHQVLDPFVTTRTTRQVGLGLPLIDMSTKRCAGGLTIQSEPGKGTLVEAVYQHSHMDRPPLGNMVETLKSIILLNPELDFSYHHVVDEGEFSLTTQEIVGNLGDMPLTSPAVIEWLHGYLSEQLANLYGGVKHENN